MSLDLIGAITLTGSAAVLIAVLSRWYGVSNPRLILWHVAWFAVVATIGATHVLDPNVLGALGMPVFGLTIAVPMIVVAILATRSPHIRTALGSIPLSVLISVNAVRMLGVLFILLYANGRLPSPFAQSAGWGDIITGATALPVAWAVSRRVPGWRGYALLWNSFGVLDLIAALVLGMTSAEGSPVRLFFGDPSTALMTGLPWLLIPAYLVPELIITHLAIYRRLGSTAETLRTVSA